MVNLRPLLAALLGTILGFLITAARAEEAYLCADGSVVYVKVGQIEEMKRTNACVAAHYGLQVQPSQTTVEPPTPATNAAQAGQPTAPALRTLPAGDEPVAAPPAQRTREAVLRVAPSADFRRVKVINAQSDAEGWFHHQR